MMPRMAAWVAVCGLTGTALAGCALPSHIHSDADEATARQAHAELAAYADKSSGVYQSMHANLGRIRSAQEQVIADLAANREKALVDTLSSFTFFEIDQRAGALLARLKGIEGRLAQRIEDHFREQKQAATAAAEARAALTAARAEVEKAQRAVTRWNQTAAVLNRVIARAATQASARQQGGVDAVVAQWRQLGDERVEYVDGGTRTTKTIKDILREQGGEGIDQAIVAQLPSAPGIDVTILRLGLELAEINRKAAEGRLAALGPRLDLYEDSYGALRLSRTLLEDLRFDIASPGSQLPFHLYMAQAMREARHEQRALDIALRQDHVTATQEVYTIVSELAGRLAALRRLAVADTVAVRTELMLDLGEARLAHEESIAASRANDEMWQAVLRSGIDGLVAYHQGGFTREDAANIIRIAQAIALAFIAGGVY